MIVACKFGLFIFALDFRLKLFSSVTSKLQDTELRPLLSNWLTSVGERSRLITALEFARIARVDGAQ